MSEHQYRTHWAYSNSDLSELFNLRMGKPARTIDPKAAQFGTTFHAMVLEDKYDNLYQHTDNEINALMGMYYSLMSKVPNWAYLWRKPGYHEIERFWTCKETGLPLKGKIDAQWINGSALFDLKTTSCKTEAEFINSFTDYGYDRQAAFYLDAFNLVNQFYFVGVQKKEPYNVFIVGMRETAERDAMIKLGRAKNQRLLQDAYQESLKPDGWRPSSWSRVEIQ